MTAVKWLEVHIDTNHTGLEPVETMLSALGIDGVVIDDETEFEDFLENNGQYWDYVDEDLRQEMQGRSRITFYLEAGDEGFAKLGEVRIALEELKKTRDDCGTLLMTLDDLEDADWENNWKQYYKPMEIGDRLLVVPEWLREDPKVRAGLAAGRVALVLDPGLTFGTGSHATTRLCLTALEKTIRGGERVLDLGCGYGWHCQYAVEHGAAEAMGVDSSRRMLSRARELHTDERIAYRLAAMESLDFPAASFHVVLSSLAFHYVADFPALVGRVAQWLRPGGSFVFSVEHPVFTSYGTQDWWYGPDGTILHFPVDRYFEEGPREAVFLGETMTKYHRTLTTYLQTLLEQGLVLRQVVEPRPPQEMMDLPGMREELRRPMMLLLSAHKPE